jgi:hypothetical protein
MSSSTLESILQQIAAIERMERGTLCILREGPNGPYFNFQRRENGHHVSHYVPADQVPIIRENVEAYEQFKSLVEEYVQLLSGRTRAERLAGGKKNVVPANPPRPRSRVRAVDGSICGAAADRRSGAATPSCWSAPPFLGLQTR